MPRIGPADDEVTGSTVLVDSRRVGVWRFGSAGGWPLVWNHGGLSCGLDAKVMDEAGRHCGAEIIAIDRPRIGRSDLWSMASIGQWGRTVAQVADLLHLGEFAVAGWSGGGALRACGGHRRGHGSPRATQARLRVGVLARRAAHPHRTL